jgi:hypothetical protein
MRNLHICQNESLSGDRLAPQPSSSSVAHRRRRVLAVIIAVAISIIIVSSSSSSISSTSLVLRRRQQHRRRKLWPSSTTSFNDPKTIEYKLDIQTQQQQALSLDPLATLLGPREATAVLPPYTFANVLHTIPRYHHNIAILIYDPNSDKFIIHYSTQMKWIPGCQKLITSLQMLSNSLRLLFPTRFDPRMMQDELALSVSSGDFPSLRWNDCLREQHTDCKAHNYNEGDEDLPLSPILLG